MSPLNLGSAPTYASSRSPGPAKYENQGTMSPPGNAFTLAGPVIGESVQEPSSLSLRLGTRYDSWQLISLRCSVLLERSISPDPFLPDPRSS